MSVIFAFASKTGGCIATDSQRTDLKTGKPYFDAVKSRRISHDLVVGYAGHVESCEAILNKALELFVPSSCNLALKFYQALEKACASFNSTYYNTAQKDGKFFNSFLIVGYNRDGSTMILIFGTVTNYKVLACTPINNSPISFGFIPPFDVNKDVCATIAIDTMKECAPDYLLNQIANTTVQKVVDLSHFCGGATQILQIQRHPDL